MPKLGLATHCMDCGIAREDCPEGFVGRRCKPCRKIYMAQYYKDHEEHLHALNKRNQQMANALKPKKVRTKLPEEELKRRSKVRNDNYNFKKKVKLYIEKHPELFHRKPIKKNIDREHYVDNEIFLTPLYYLNFDALADSPMEFFSTDYWEMTTYTLSAEMNEYIAKRDALKLSEDIARQKSSYCKPDEELGLREDGTIKFYPT